MLTTLPVIGVAYLIRLYSGRAHWAVATLYGLLAWVCTFAFLVEFTGAETPLNMSAIASIGGACILAFPGERIPGIEEGNESGVKDENVNESGIPSGTEDTNDSQNTNQADSTDQNTPPLSDLSELKSELEETRQLLDQLREQKGETSPERYERLRQQYRGEIKRLKSEIGRLREQGTSRKKELEDRLSQQRNRQEDIEAELGEIETLYEEGAMRESTYQEERSQLREELESAKQRISQIGQEIDEVDFYLSEIEEFSDPEPQTQKASRRKDNQSHQTVKTEEKKPEQNKHEVFGSWQGRLAVIVAILLLPVRGLPVLS